MNDTDTNFESQPWRIGGPKVLVLVGLIGSGKVSITVATLVSDTHLEFALLHNRGTERY